MSDARAPLLLLSAKGTKPETADDYQCDYEGCEKQATGYLFFGPQFCDEHRDRFA